MKWIDHIIQDDKHSKSLKGCDDGMTELMFAAANSDIKIVETLLKGGADIDITNDRGMTALMFAAENRQVEIIRILIEYGADVDIQSDIGFTALDYASNNGYTKIVEILSDDNGQRL